MITEKDLKVLEQLILSHCEKNQKKYHDNVYADEHRYFKNGFCVGFIMSMRATTEAIEEFKREIIIKEETDTSSVQEF